MKRNSPEDSQKKAQPDVNKGSASAHHDSFGRREKGDSVAKADPWHARPTHGPQFFTSAQRPAGVMWMRQSGEVAVQPSVPEQAGGSRYPVPSTEAVALVQELAEARKNPVDSVALAPHAAMDIGARKEQTEEPWAGYGFEPPSKYQRPFWNEPQARPPNPKENRDALPVIEPPTAEAAQPVEAAPESEKPRVETADEPSLDQAVNPNASLAYTEAVPESRPADRNIAAKPGFLGRRRAKAALQSGTMEGVSKLEQSPGSVRAGELTPALESADLPEGYDALAPEPAAAEFAAPASLEQAASQPEEVDHVAVLAEQKPVRASFEQVMQQRELLELAKAIRIDGVSVSEMFEAGRIDEEGLRRIVVAYLRGGELRQLISQEVIRQQMKFERDPQLRDTPISTATNTKRTRPLIKRHTKPLIDVGRTLDRTERAAAFTQEQVEKAYQFFTENPKAIQALSIGAIFVIYAAILVLILRR